MTFNTNYSNLTAADARELLDNEPLVFSATKTLDCGSTAHLVDLGAGVHLLAIEAADGTIVEFGLMSAGNVAALGDELEQLNEDSCEYACTLADSLRHCFYRSTR
ncbi:hypothetical protein [Malikia spinosa]|uniref:Uncharacterized protein n=1 Tax=Malikia spinosa TaxID=86180 RepID=A0A7C9NIN5_9BURK|nr:hypothetical protein [Malikia spinosa]MYZ53683.1 hypothetical protein [Malikia spinosa]